MGAHVLVIEDDPDVSRSIADALETSGYSVRVASDGDEALAACEQWAPDVIVLDHNLPVMSGEQFLKEIRWQPALSRVPILLISALGELGAIAHRLHVQHYLTKPFTPRALLEAIARTMRGAVNLPQRSAHPFPPRS
jgi:DNA-binding response OmpR family regulator